MAENSVRLVSYNARVRSITNSYDYIYDTFLAEYDYVCYIIHIYCITDGIKGICFLNLNKYILV